MSRRRETPTNHQESQEEKRLEKRKGTAGQTHQNRDVSSEEEECLGRRREMRVDTPSTTKHRNAGKSVCSNQSLHYYKRNINKKFNQSISITKLKTEASEQQHKIIQQNKKIDEQLT